ncbi:MAG: sigma-70 family RNA polymerase sigma factor [Candidatus Dadabacteria bacterium]|nr:MAG: sigma-70 family RNA polymerase sigma factor [Candidatus Dadabacteria bacterium]
MGFNTKYNCAVFPDAAGGKGVPAFNFGGLPDEELVAIFTEDGDEGAFSEIVDRYADRIYGTVLRILRDPSDAEDVLQEVFLILATKAGTFRRESKFSTWLYMVALNASYMRIRADKKIRSNEMSIEDYAPYDESGALSGVVLKDFSRIPDRELLSREGVEIIMNAIDELPDQYRVVFHLMQEQGLRAAEIAEVLGISVSNVKSRLHRSRLYLRDRLADYFYETGR